jgi:hypothetical protein
MFCKNVTIVRIDSAVSGETAPDLTASRRLCATPAPVRRTTPNLG